ncbi:hypothetical protein BU26DRAFT_571299 [Trematosphaeria pertusa]|uniref:TPR-like protein n=1 Tax=Trematosphaeria pertusa TaxID=390896 RepID=A0A6A6HWB8_9PLEO|nr:uncharacterized protein BU26DRAFT_571299 [Trematosphaeria pertusa]KAF2242058.1 hypothetical protein BU26DRAFT_571299 [Trematosphaeria pertusa]
MHGLSANSFRLLMRLVFLDPHHIPEKLIVHLPDYEVARDELVKSALVKRKAEPEEGLAMQEPAQDALRGGLLPMEWRRALVGVVGLLLNVWSFTTFETRNQPARWKVYEMCVPHAARLREIVSPEKAPCPSECPADIVFDMARIFDDAAWYSAERASSPEETAAFARATWTIVDTMRTTDLLEVIDRVFKQWDIARDSLALAICYNNLGIAYSLLNDIPASLDAWEMAYAGFGEREGRVLDCTWPAASLALVYAQRGEPEKGAKFLDPVFDELLDRRGCDDRTTSETGVILRARGHLRVAEENVAEALGFHELALANLRVTLGNSHYQTADCMYNLAQDLLHFRRYEEASKLLDEAIEAYGDIPRYRPTAARALWRKGRLLRETRRHLEAEGFLREAMRVRREIVPEDERGEGELKEEDWDALVDYYSR